MMKRMLRIAKLALVVLAGVIAAVVLAAAVVSLPPVQRLIVRRAEARVEGAIREIAATGAPVKLTQLAKPPMPDAENAALVYRKAFAALHGISEHRQFIVRVASGEASLADPAVAAEAKEILRSNAEALRLIRQASAMPRCDFRLAWTKGWFGLTFPHFRPLRQCSYLLSLEASMLAHQGRADDALSTYGANLALSRAADEPVLIGPLVRYAIIGIAWRPLSGVLRDSQLSASACRALAKDIAGLDVADPYIDAVKGERALGIAVFEKARASPDPMKDILKLAGEVGEATPYPRAARTPFTRWWLVSDELTYLRLIGQLVEQASLPYRKAVSIHPSVDERLGGAPIYWPPRGLLTAILLPALTNPPVARDTAIARLGLAQIALLLKARRAEQGGYPQSLAQLDGINGRRLPTDPFSGKPFVYRRAGEGFLIYSWGPNLKDDGGTPPPPKQQGEGDIVMRCAR